MKQIKIRAWDNAAEKMIYVGADDNYSFGFDSYGVTCIALSDTETHEEGEKLEHLHYMWYTGVHDSEGTEICEGDCVEVTTRNNIVEIDVVEFCHGAFFVGDEPLFELIKLRDEEVLVFKIKRNIYEEE